MAKRSAVLLMAYGTPRSLEDVEAYYTDIRHGRPPPRDLLNELIDRYRAIGGRSPLHEITQRQATALGERLNLPVYVGMKHSSPTIADAVTRMARDEIRSATGIVLAPHYSSMSVGDYRKRAERAAELAAWTGRLTIIDSWHLEPGYIRLLADRVEKSRGEVGGMRPHVLFTAHSLPASIVRRGDPYPAQLHETAAAVAALAGVEDFGIAWQSAGRTDDEWLGPDLLDAMRDVAGAGADAVVVCPCGFVADHLEVLYDVDIEAKVVAADLGIAMARTPSPNDDPEFIEILASVAGRAQAR